MSYEGAKLGPEPTKGTQKNGDAATETNGKARSVFMKGVCECVKRSSLIVVAVLVNPAKK